MPWNVDHRALSRRLVGLEPSRTCFPVAFYRSQLVYYSAMEVISMLNDGSAVTAYSRGLGRLRWWGQRASGYVKQYLSIWCTRRPTHSSAQRSIIDETDCCLSGREQVQPRSRQEED